MLKLSFLTAIFVLLLRNDIGSAFNLSPVPNAVIKVPNFRTHLPQTRSTYFGFSIVLRDKSIIIGAPRAQSTLSAQANINETGAIYRCPLPTNPTRDFNESIICNPYIVEASSNLYFSDYRMNEVRDFQWLGGSMDGDGKDSDPLLVCAPRFDGSERIMEEIYDYMHGICYRLSNTLTDTPHRSQIQKIKPFPYRPAVSQDWYESHYAFQLGQLGLSAHMTSNNKECIMGAPGVNNWGGTAVRYRSGSESLDIPAVFSKDHLVYTGYAVASGYLHSAHRNELFYIATAPHAQEDYGLFTIYQYSRKHKDNIDIYKRIRGSQYGEYYGYAALVTDINGDRLDDIIITAPLYRLRDIIDIGAIYVYINTGNLAFKRQLIEAPFETEARFGTTISTLGDINNDGFNDIAVGAPFVAGKGAVVIYLGSRTGLQTSPSQILSLPAEFGGNFGYFGHGLSKGVDIDGNDYNDLAIGAPNSETVYIYYTYPVVKVMTNISTSEPFIDLNTQTIEYEVCFRVDRDFTGIVLELTADAELRRVRFGDNNAYSIQQEVLAAKFEKCQVFKASLAYVASQVFIPIRTVLTFKLLNDGTKHFEQEFCRNCVTLDPKMSTTNSWTMKYRHGCASDVCNVDLSIEAADVLSEITVGNSTILTIKYNIYNLGERAFDTQVSIRNSLNLPFARIPSICFESMANEMICELTKGMSYLENSTTLEITYDLTNITQADELEIAAKVTSTGNELNSVDNIINSKIKLALFSTLEIECLLNENMAISNTEDTALEAVYMYSLNNLGPSPVRDVNIWFKLPVTYLDEATNEISYLNITELELNGLLDSDELPHSKFELLSMGEATTQQQFDLELYGLPVNRTLVQYCHSKGTLCARSMLNLPLLEKAQTLTLRLNLKVNPAAISKILKKKFTNLALFVNITAELGANSNGIVTVVDQTTPIVVEYCVKPVTPLWIYIVAIVGGLLVLALLTFSLWKFGFFKRQTKDDMEELLNAKLEKERRQIDTEANVEHNNASYDNQ